MSQTRTQVSVYIATSLDGFIARPDGDVDWLHEGEPPPEGEDYGWQAFMDSIDILVMGRNTFEKVLTFGSWPYQKPVVVLSRSLTIVPEHLKSQVTIEAAEPHSFIQSLTERGIKRIYLDGGALIQSFLRAGLVDDLCITRIPRLLGQGIPLFGSLEQDILLQLTDVKSWPNGLVKTTYKVQPNPS